MILGDFQRIKSCSCFEGCFQMCLAGYGDSVSVGREAETSGHISVLLWQTLQGYRSQPAWARLSLTCYESIADWGWSIASGGGNWGERTARRGPGRGSICRSGPGACHSPCTAAWPPTLSGLRTMGGPLLNCMSSHSPTPPHSSKHRKGQKESKHAGRALALFCTDPGKSHGLRQISNECVPRFPLNVSFCRSQLSPIQKSKLWQRLLKIISLNTHAKQLSRVIKR